MSGLFYLMGFIDCKPSVGHDSDESEVEFVAEDGIHLSIIPGFQIKEAALEPFTEMLSRLIPWYDTLSLTPTQRIMVGPENQIPAVKIEGCTDTDTENLISLHYDLCNLLEHSGGAFLFPEFTRANFLPHVSFCPSNNAFQIKSFQLINHSLGFGKGLRKIGEFTLGGG